jgi:hypothetical protein
MRAIPQPIHGAKFLRQIPAPNSCAESRRVNRGWEVARTGP